MSRTTALIVGVVSLAVVGAVAATLVINFNGKDTGILLAAILGFLTPTIASLLTLLQASMNAEKTLAVGQAVADVNSKVDGHLSRLTQIVVDSATSGQPVSQFDAAALAVRAEQLTGVPIVRTSAVDAATSAHTATQNAAVMTERAQIIAKQDATTAGQQPEQTAVDAKNQLLESAAMDAKRKQG
jgi:hypothetical protein